MPIFIRHLIVYVFVAVILVYAWRDWFKCLCGLILLTPFIGRHDFPVSIAGIQGLNVWNVLFADIFLAWWTNRKQEGLSWEMPKIINIFLALWLGVILVGWIRMIVDRSLLMNHGLIDLFSEELINTIKWPIVGLLLFDGCRTRHHTKLAFICTFLFFAMFVVQIIKCVPPVVILEPGNMDARGNISSDVGISINGASRMLSGVPWAMIAMTRLLRAWKHRLFLFGACFMSLYAVALTGSRSGYTSCGVSLLLLCLLRWRRYLLFLPLLFFVLLSVFPGAKARFLQGFNQVDITGENFTDPYYVTAGRSDFWPYVLSKIPESPIYGFGRRAMQRAGVQKSIENELGADEAVAHPHNAFLEVLLDSGLIGFFVIIGFYLIIWMYAVRLFVDRGDPLCTTAGGIVLALLTSYLIASMGGQSFYSEETDVGLWSAIGVMLRVYVARSRLVDDVNSVSTTNIHIDGRIPAPQTSWHWANSWQN